MIHEDEDNGSGLLAAFAGATNAIDAASATTEPIAATASVIVRAPGVIQQALGKSAAEVIVGSKEYRNALLADFRQLPIDNPGLVDKYFSAQAFPSLFAHSPSAHVGAWEHILEILLAEDEQRYRKMHKGTPFYFAGTASYLARDFEKALFYMDAALEEDLRLHKTNWPKVPSGKFVLLDSDSPDQFARLLVARTRALVESIRTKVQNEGGIGLSVDEFRSKLVYPAMGTAPAKRSALTALISFLLEFQSRVIELTLAGSQTSTAEPFFLHLFKGAVIFETLLKTSTAGINVQRSRPRATIDHFLRDSTIYSAFGFAAQPQGLGGDTLDDVFVSIKNDERTGLGYTQRAVRATWGIRNKVGHSMAWSSRPTREEYADIFYLIAGAIGATLCALHP